MKKINALFALLFFIILISSAVNAQESSKRTWGLSAAVSQTQLDILAPIWMGSRHAFGPALGVINIGGSGTDLHLGLFNRVYFNIEKDIKPYVGLRAGILLLMPKEGDTVADYLAGIAGGGEYFFSENFSAGVEAQLNFTVSDDLSTRFGNPGEMNINTASVIFVTVYF
jgi:hypothetical protein